LVALGIAVGRTTPGVLIRIGLAAATLLGALVIFAPWWAYNIPRFKEPVLFSSELGDTIEGANCPTTYSGPLVGSWSLACTLAVKSKPGTDPSQQDDQLRHVAVEYAEHHKSRWPAVVAARFGREFGLFHPFGQIDLEWSELGRPRLPATMGLFAFYALAAAAAGGAWILRRRKIPLLPIWAIGADVVLSAIATFGETRYRTGLDVALIVLAGVLVANVDWPLTRRRGDARHAAHRAPPGSDPPAQTATSGPSSTHEPLPLPRG
jgi:hypothetical protein